MVAMAHNGRNDAAMAPGWRRDDATTAAMAPMAETAAMATMAAVAAVAVLAAMGRNGVAAACDGAAIAVTAPLWRRDGTANGRNGREGAATAAFM